MKKSLLFASAILVAASASAIVRDGDTYEEFTIGDKTYTITNRWMTSLNYDAENFAASPLSKDNGGAYYRTACIAGDYILVSGSPSRDTGEVDDEGAAITTNVGVIEVYNLSDGSFVKELTLTHEDESLLTGTLCANQIGCDDAGNVWVAGAMFDANTKDFQFYLVDIETGKLTALPPISPLNYGLIPETIGAEGTKARMDYYDVKGDITGETGPAYVMGAFNDSAAALSLLRATRDEGGDEFYGASTDDMFYNDPSAITETYPMVTNEETGEKKPIANWGTAPIVRMIDDGAEYTQFYVDGFTTAPSIYDVSMAFIDGFANKVELTPNVGTNGIAEFNLGGNNFVVYSLQQYDKDPGCQSRIACFGEGFSYADLQTCWDFPVGGLGTLSDGGNRVHNLFTKKFVDEGGNEAVYVLNFKCCNGLAVYVVAEKDFVDPNPLPDYPEIGGVDTVESDNVNAPAEYFNLQGVRVANPQNGLYIVRQGSKVSKQVIR